MEAVQRWRAEKESRLSGEKQQQQQEEEEEESIYTVHNEQVNCPFSCSANMSTGSMGLDIKVQTAEFVGFCSKVIISSGSVSGRV